MILHLLYVMDLQCTLFGNHVLFHFENRNAHISEIVCLTPLFVFQVTIGTNDEEYKP